MDDESKLIDVFGIAMAAGTDRIPMPETKADWLIITNKIDNGQIDGDVVLATYSDVWPEKYDKIDIRNRYNSKILYTLEYNTDTGIFEGMSYARALPSGDELDAIWQKMLEEIEQETTENKKPKK